MAKWSRPAKGLCQRCGFKYQLAQLVTEWTGLRVCKSCRDPRPQSHFKVKLKPEGVPKRGHSPEIPSVAVSRFGLTADAGPITIATTFGESVGSFTGRTADSGDLLTVADMIVGL